jgi:hypothetical protein
MARPINPIRRNAPTLDVKNIQDIYVRSNFQNLQGYFEENNQLLGFRFFELEFTKAEKNFRVEHSLTVTPVDIIVVHTSGSALISFNIGLFDSKQMDITVTGPCRVRFFAGTYWNSPGDISTDPNATMVFEATSGTGEVVTALAGRLPGEVITWPSPRLPRGYEDHFYWCDGRNYRAVDNPELAYALWDPATERYAYGGTGIYPNGTFNVPDVRGIFWRGVDGGRGTDPNASTRTASGTGGNTGNAVGSYQGDGVATHTHSVAGNTGGESNDHQHITAGAYVQQGQSTAGGPTVGGTGTTSFVGTSGGWGVTTTTTVGSGWWSLGRNQGHTHAYSATSSANSGAVAETRPKNLYTNYIIKR